MHHHAQALVLMEDSVDWGLGTRTTIRQIQIFPLRRHRPLN
ncbi:hypothetical protein ES702_03571 [subsurface metagenome]